MTAGPLNFCVTASEVQVRVGRFVVRRILLADIARVDVASTFRVPLWNEHWCNLWPLRFVVLRRKSGWLSNFIINPPDPEAFLADLRRQAPHLDQP